MPHDKHDRFIAVGDYVIGRIEVAPRQFWEGLARVIEVRDGDVCNATIAEIEGRRWQDDDNNDSSWSGAQGYGWSLACVPSHRGGEYRIDVRLVEVTTRDLTVIYSSLQGGVCLPQTITHYIARPSAGRRYP